MAPQKMLQQVGELQLRKPLQNPVLYIVFLCAKLSLRTIGAHCVKAVKLIPWGAHSKKRAPPRLREAHGKPQLLAARLSPGSPLSSALRCQRAREGKQPSIARRPPVSCGACALGHRPSLLELASCRALEPPSSCGDIGGRRQKRGGGDSAGGRRRYRGEGTRAPRFAPLACASSCSEAAPSTQRGGCEARWRWPPGWLAGRRARKPAESRPRCFPLQLFSPAWPGVGEELRTINSRGYGVLACHRLETDAGGQAGERRLGGEAAQLALSAEKILLTFNQFISIPVIIHFLFIFFTISQMQYNVKELISLARRPSSCFDKEGKLTICRMLRDGKCIGKNSWHWQSSVHVCLAAVVCSLF
uniref:uncharacterized protein LOC114604459 n=1 Tax=Podarcis muralis TaxID=64176 RepID=UPI00109F28C0|nr:uncharacterized protein LOC114604459 [Podarcis muralis]